MKSQGRGLVVTLAGVEIRPQEIFMGKGVRPQAVFLREHSAGESPWPCCFESAAQSRGGVSEPQVGTTVDTHFHCDGADRSSFQSSTLSLRQVGFGLGMRRKEMRRVQERYREGARPYGARLTVYYNPSTWKTEVGRSEVHGHPQLYGEFKANLSYETW